MSVCYISCIRVSGKIVFEIVKSGGWMMWPILLASVAAMAIVGERFWSLQRKNVVPQNLFPSVQQWIAKRELSQNHIAFLRDSSPLGRVFAVALLNNDKAYPILKEAVEDAGRHAVPELERYLNTLGTIAAVSPFLGLLGTVLGMIQMFSGIGTQGVGDPALVASGIAQALITTAAGLLVAIPSLMFYRYFRGRVNELAVAMEQEAQKLLALLQSPPTKGAR